MASPFKLFNVLISSFIAANLLAGCISYRFVKVIQGREVPLIPEEYRTGKTTLKQALETLGAPDKVAEVEGRDVLIYRRSCLANSGLSFGIPFSDLVNFDVSGSGTLARYDVLILFFASDGTLTNVVSEKGSDHRYLKTIFDDKKRD